MNNEDVVTHVVESGEASLHVRHLDTCTGTPVVLLHAGVTDWRMWESVVKSLDGDHNLIAYDRRGFGRSQAPDQPFSHVADLEAVLDHVGSSAAVLVGCSQGGRVAIDFTLAHPQRVKALGLISTAISGAQWPEKFDPPIAEVVADYERADESGDPETLNRIEARVWLDGPLATEGRVGGELRALFLEMNRIALRNEATQPLTKELEPEQATDRLSQIACPAWVVAGSLDFPHIVNRSRDIAGNLNTSFELLDGLAHLVPFEQPLRFALSLRNFLKKVLYSAPVSF